VELDSVVEILIDKDRAYGRMHATGTSTKVLCVRIIASSNIDLLSCEYAAKKNRTDFEYKKSHVVLLIIHSQRG
jgi:hypothetical protein